MPHEVCNYVLPLGFHPPPVIFRPPLFAASELVLLSRKSVGSVVSSLVSRIHTFRLLRSRNMRKTQHPGVWCWDTVFCFLPSLWSWCGFFAWCERIMCSCNRWSGHGICYTLPAKSTNNSAKNQLPRRIHLHHFDQRVLKHNAKEQATPFRPRMAAMVWSGSATDPSNCTAGKPARSNASAKPKHQCDPSSVIFPARLDPLPTCRFQLRSYFCFSYTSTKFFAVKDSVRVPSVVLTAALLCFRASLFQRVTPTGRTHVRPCDSNLSVDWHSAPP